MLAVDEDVRSTPTRVGRTYEPQMGGGHGAVHPHARGENTTLRMGCAGSELDPFWWTPQHVG